MLNIVEAIAFGNLDEARELVNESLKEISAQKIEETKKIVASEHYRAFMRTRTQKKVAMDVLEYTEEPLDEAARTKIIRLRIRNGKIQRRKKVSNLKGYTIRGGKLTRMSAKERRDRKMGARRARFKRRAKMARTLMKRKRSLQKRKRLGL